MSSEPAWGLSLIPSTRSAGLHMTPRNPFTFPSDTQRYLRDLRTHNTKPWFEANRDRYETAYLAPARAFVDAVGPQLQELVPGVSAEARVNGSIFRINRDIRFSADKTPYKDHLDFWFWEGERRTALSGLFLRVAPEAVTVGAGAHGFDRQQLAAYRNAVVDRGRGNQLVDIVAGLEATGHSLAGERSARLPRGYDADGEPARLLRHRGLAGSAELPASVATDPDLIATLLRHWRLLAPLHRWLTTNIG